MSVRMRIGEDAKILFTGSTTRFCSLCFVMRFAMTSMVSADASMPNTSQIGHADEHINANQSSNHVCCGEKEKDLPVLTTSTPISSTQASICSPTNPGGTTCTFLTPRVFCAVKAVVAVRA